jgi:excisionase family DNA binding protein
MIAKQDHQPEQTEAAKLDRLISKSEAAKVLAVSTRTIDRLCARDLIPKLHVGGSVRFRLSDVIGIVQNGV